MSQKSKSNASDSIVGFGILLGGAIGATIGLILAGGAGLAIGTAFGAVAGIVLGAMTQSFFRDRN